jgi:hypothetical protein
MFRAHVLRPLFHHVFFSRILVIPWRPLEMSQAQNQVIYASSNEAPRAAKTNIGIRFYSYPPRLPRVRVSLPKNAMVVIVVPLLRIKPNPAGVILQVA